MCLVDFAPASVLPRLLLAVGFIRVARVKGSRWALSGSDLLLIGRTSVDPVTRRVGRVLTSGELAGDRGRGHIPAEVGHWRIRARWIDIWIVHWVGVSLVFGEYRHRGARLWTS